MCEVAVGQDVSQLSQKCISWMQEQYVRDVVSIKILEPRRNVQEPGTGYFFRTMTVRSYLFLFNVHCISSYLISLIFKY
jgi:hypothetical protein